MRQSVVLALILGAGTAGAGRAGPAAGAEAAPAIAPVDEKEKARLLAAESSDQQRLRAELAALAREGQKIYFNANCAGNHDIYVMGPDGSNLTQLTRDPAQDNYPHCSPDGRKVVFTSDRVPLRLPLSEPLKGVPVDPRFPVNSPGKWNRLSAQAGSFLPANHGPGAVVWIMNADGSDPRPAAFGGLPAWSPDGKFLAYTITSYPHPDQLAIMNLEKGTEACLAHPALKNCGYPAFSPDGNWVIGTHPAAGVVRLNADKTAAEKVIVFETSNSCNGELSADGKWWFYVVDSTDLLGSYIGCKPMDFERPFAQARLLPTRWPQGTVNYFPAPSPEGRYLVYAHGERRSGVRSWLLDARQELYVTRLPDCETTVRITWNNAANQHPHWVGPAVPASGTKG